MGTTLTPLAQTDVVKKSGDTMTGPLIINLPASATALELQIAGVKSGEFAPDGVSSLGVYSVGHLLLRHGAGKVIQDETLNRALVLSAGATLVKLEAKVSAGASDYEAVTWTAAYAAAPVVVPAPLYATEAAMCGVISRSTTGAVLQSATKVGGALTCVKLALAMEAN